MIISNLIGGLGNQMFQFAAGWALAQQKGEVFKVDISGFSNYQLHQGFELQRIFPFEVEVASAEDLKAVLGWQSNRLVARLLARPSLRHFRKSSFVVESQFGYQNLHELIRGDAYLSGYWQSEKYFRRFGAEIRQQFRFMSPLSDENKNWSELISGCNSISLHVRRGDYLSKKNIGVHGVCSLEYYETAVKRICEHVSSPEFFIFSDDMDWVRSNLRIPFRFHCVENNNGKDSFNDMRLMSLCKHHIIANSSFSWWGAWLNPDPDKVVIAPKKWFASGLPTGDLLPESWNAL